MRDISLLEPKLERATTNSNVSNMKMQPHSPPAKSLLGANEDVGDVLVLAEQGDVQQDLERLAVGGKHHELGLTTVQSLGRLICPLVMRYLLVL